MALLEIKGLQKAFKDVKAVNGVNLCISEQEIHGILGPNGAGKSTTLNCLLGLLPYDAGEVTFEDGVGIRKWSKHIGYVPQDLALYPELTARENVRFFCSLYGFKGAELHDKVEKALELVGLEDVADKKSGEFSGGMKRRLNLACGIAHSPKLIIMDEPTVGIDPQSRNRILENVKALNEAGATILYTTHYMPEVEEICSKVTIIDHGKVIATGTKSEIIGQLGSDTELTLDFGEDADVSAFTESASQMGSVHSAKTDGGKCIIKHSEDDTLLEKLMSTAHQYGLRVRSISEQEASLEEIFLDLTGKALRDGK
ncbi:MAG: ABC transporter ATP-binding protein [Oscillospiraceae bacterium]|nr:ABC transporter ATP-binding protein [Oscillospiraceae bacterium]